MAEIKINSGLWDQLNSDEKEQIKTILVDSGLIQEEDEIVGDADTVEFDLTAPVQLFTVPLQPMLVGGESNACRQRCDEAAIRARAACLIFPHWLGKAVCFAAVEGGLWACREICG